MVVGEEEVRKEASLRRPRGRMLRARMSLRQSHPAVAPIGVAHARAIANLVLGRADQVQKRSSSDAPSRQRPQYPMTHAVFIARWAKNSLSNPRRSGGQISSMSVGCVSIGSIGRPLARLPLSDE